MVFNCPSEHCRQDWHSPTRVFGSLLEKDLIFRGTEEQIFLTICYILSFLYGYIYSFKIFTSWSSIKHCCKLFLQNDYQ